MGEGSFSLVASYDLNLALKSIITKKNDNEKKAPFPISWFYKVLKKIS